MEKYGRIKRHLCQFKTKGYPPCAANQSTPFYILDEAEANASDVDADPCGALLQQLSSLAGCVQDDAVIAAKRASAA